MLLNVATELGVFSFFCLIALGLERLNPVDRVFDGPGVVRNYVVGYFFLFGQELSLIAMGFVLAHRHGLFSFGKSVSFGGAVLLTVLWLLGRDFFYYWFHRLQHTSKWLWPQHAVHHSDEHVNATTTFRHHWLEMPLTAIFVYLPLNLLFNPPITAYPILAGAISWIGLVNHMNIRVSLGRFGWVISTPQNHRIHHSTRPEHEDKNFAAYFPIWDVLFGTYYQPKEKEYPPTGLSSGERVTSVWQALVLPFQLWKRMLSK